MKIFFSKNVKKNKWLIRIMLGKHGYQVLEYRLVSVIGTQIVQKLQKGYKNA